MAPEDSGRADALELPRSVASIGQMCSRNTDSRAGYVFLSRRNNKLTVAAADGTRGIVVDVAQTGKDFETAIDPEKLVEVQQLQRAVDAKSTTFTALAADQVQVTAAGATSVASTEYANGPESGRFWDKIVPHVRPIEGQKGSNLAAETVVSAAKLLEVIQCLGQIVNDGSCSNDQLLVTVPIDCCQPLIIAKKNDAGTNAIGIVAPIVGDSNDDDTAAITEIVSAVSDYLDVIANNGGYSVEQILRALNAIMLNMSYDDSEAD